MFSLLDSFTHWLTWLAVRLIKKKTKTPYHKVQNHIYCRSISHKTTFKKTEEGYT